jgi:hypothetical protein
VTIKGTFTASFWPFKKKIPKKAKRGCKKTQKRQKRAKRGRKKTQKRQKRAKKGRKST